MKNRLRTIILFLILVMLVVGLSSCTTTNVVYISDAQIDSSQTIIRTYSKYNTSWGSVKYIC